jgi:hypothetical protein
MDLTPYVDALRDELAVAAEAGGDETRALAERLTAPLESAARLALLEALSAAAGEITRELAPGSVDLRLWGREPSFVVTPPSVQRPFEAPDTSPAEALWRVPPEGDDATMTRINLRLAQDLKDRVEEAARGAGLSVNAWLVRSAAAALGASDNSAQPLRRTPRGGDHYTGWVR